MSNLGKEDQSLDITHSLMSILDNHEVIWAIFGYYSLAHEVGRVRLQLWVFIRGHSAATQAHYLLEQWAFLEEGSN